MGRRCTQDTIYIKSLNNLGFNKEITNAPSALLSYISTQEVLRTQEKCRVCSQCFLSFYYIGCESFAVYLTLFRELKACLSS